MKKYLLVILMAATLGLSAEAMMEEESPDKKGTVYVQKPLPSTAEKTGSRKSSQISSQMSSEDPFKEALSEFSRNRASGIIKIQDLANQDHLDSLLFLGSYYSNGVYVRFNGDESIKNFNKALAATTEDSIKASILNEIGSVFYALDDFEKAKTNYKKAIELGSNAAKRNIDELEKELL